MRERDVRAVAAAACAAGLLPCGVALRERWRTPACHLLARIEAKWTMMNGRKNAEGDASPCFFAQIVAETHGVIFGQFF